MAWEESKRQGKTIMIGDKPIDEMALALEKITKAYQNRFDRKPLLSEILYALEILVMSEPTSYLTDATEIKTQNIFVKNS